MIDRQQTVKDSSHELPHQPNESISKVLSICMIPPADMRYQSGSRIHVRHVVRELSLLGHEVHLLYGKGLPVQGAVNHKVRVYVNHPVVLIKPTRRRNAYEPASVEDLANGIKLYVRKALAVTGTKAFDIIHVQHCGFSFLAGLQLKWLVGGSLVITSHGMEADLIQNPTYRPDIAYDVDLARKLAQTAIYADHIIAVSDFIAKKLHENLAMPYKRISVIPNGVDVDMFNPKVNGYSIRSSYAIPLTDKLILFGGRLAYEKGLDLLIEATAIIRRSIPNLKLMLVGSADSPKMKEYLASLARRRGIADITFFSGTIPNSKMPLFYSAADVCVLPSRSEAFGISALEAMASGKPVVASTVGGIPEVVKDGLTGRLVKPEDPLELADALLELLTDEGKVREMGANGRRVVEEEFSWKVIAERTEGVYLKTIG